MAKSPAHSFGQKIGEIVEPALEPILMKACEVLTPAQRLQVAAALLARRSDAVNEFLEALKRSVTRQIKYVRVTPLHGATCEWGSLEAAIEFIERYDEGSPPGTLLRYEVELRYGNDDRISGTFGDRATAIEFVRSYLPTLAQPAVDAEPTRAAGA